MERLLCTRHCARHWGDGNELKGHEPSSPWVRALPGKIKNQQLNCKCIKANEVGQREGEELGYSYIKKSGGDLSDQLIFEQRPWRANHESTWGWACAGVGTWQVSGTRERTCSYSLCVFLSALRVLWGIQHMAMTGLWLWGWVNPIGTLIWPPSLPYDFVQINKSVPYNLYVRGGFNLE